MEEVKFYNKDNRSITKSAAAERGFTYDWKWHLYSDVMNGRIMETNGKDFFSFTFKNESIVEVKLSKLDGYTLIELTRKNIATDDDFKQFIRLGCALGWSFYLINLKSVYEEGIPIYMRITVDGLPKEISTGRDYDPFRWNSKANRAS